jgi:predicted metal-dependent phosphotriesterase family hydrolase
MFIALLLKNGITKDEIELMAKINPAKLLGLD